MTLLPGTSLDSLQRMSSRNPPAGAPHQASCRRSQARAPSTEIRLGARRGGTRRTRPAPIHQRRRAVHPDDLTTPLPSFPAATWSGAGRPAARSVVRGALHLDPAPSGTTNQRLRGSRGEKVHPAPQSDGHHGLDGVGDLTDKGLVLPNGSGSLITGV